MHKFRQIIKTDDDMLLLLRSMKDFNFYSICFESDIDLYALLEVNPIEGIVLLERPQREIKPNRLKLIAPLFDISYLRFNKPVSFLGCTFKIHLEVNEVILKSGIVLNHSKFEQGFSFLGVKAEGTSVFGFSSRGSVLIKESSFISIECPKVEIDESFRIIDSSFNSDLDFNKFVVRDQLQISEVNLKSKLNFAEAEIGSLFIGDISDVRKLTEIDGLILSEAKISGQVQMSNLLVSGKVLAGKITFNEIVSLRNVEFNDSVIFSHCTFEKSIQSQDVTVKKLLSFYGARFNSEMNFTNMNLTDANISFAGAHINSDLWLGSLLHKDPVIFKGKINFEGSIIDNRSVVRIFNLNNGDKPLGVICYLNAIIKGLLDIRNVYVQAITFDGTVVLGNIQDNNTLHISIHDRNSARLLKHEAKKINNMISATSYYKLEMNLYAKSISCRQLSDWLILKLTRWSNNYGTNWGQAAIFTLISGLMCYTFFIIFNSDFRFFLDNHWSFLFTKERFWSGFINYFWLPAGLNELVEGGKVSGGILGAIVFILGKILIAFGIYQTIAAFRKFL